MSGRAVRARVGWNSVRMPIEMPIAYRFIARGVIGIARVGRPAAPAMIHARN